MTTAAECAHTVDQQADLKISEHNPVNTFPKSAASDLPQIRL
jgi:hypothetical protein